MNDTGIDNTQSQPTGIDKENIKAHLEYQTENTKLTLGFKEKWLEKIFSPNFLVFLVTIIVLISGFAFMQVEGVAKSDILDFWKLILPVVTTYIGYAIGKGKSSDS